MKSIPENVNFEVNPQESLFEQVTYREDCGYKDLSDKFRTKTRDYTHQYAHIYSKRLEQMKDTLMKRSREKWGSNVIIRRLAELQEDVGGECVIIGTLFKDQELRPSILKELSDELEVIPQKKMVRFVSETDKVILEDEEQRIVLIGNIEIHSIVTGVECAVLGSEDHSGKFNVKEVCFPGPQSPSPFSRQPKESKKFALFLSGLNLGTDPSSLPSLQLLVHWLSGWIGSSQHTISFILIAGGIIRSSSEEKEGTVVGTSIESSCDVVSSVQLADDILAELSDSMNVEIMPGQYDPTNFLFPQQPLHFQMFPKAVQNKTFNSGPNPHQFQLDNLLVIGSSGEAVNDIGRYSELTDPIEALEATLMWGHIVPTAPDSLGCYPYYDQDPFVLENQPDIFFSSNHDAFQTKLVDFDHGIEGKQTTRLICIPSFSKTNSGVLVNLGNLETTPISVDVPML